MRRDYAFIPLVIRRYRSPGKTDPRAAQRRALEPPGRDATALVMVFLAALILIGYTGPSLGGEPSFKNLMAVEEDEKLLSQEELLARRERIRSYFEDHRKRLDIVATTVTKSGQTIDWIWPWTQTTDGRIAEPPRQAVSSEGPHKEVDPRFSQPGPQSQLDESVLTEVQAYPEARGPEGTVPVVRFDVEKYLASVKIPPKNPEDVLRKMPPPAPDANDRYYVSWQRFGTFYGNGGYINIWDTSGPVNNETSIAQMAVSRGSPMQAIEAGKIEFQLLNGDLRPHFFTYYRTNGNAVGDWVGGYNTTVDGWIQVSPSVAPGMSLAARESQTGGNQYNLDVVVRLYQGNWWVWAAGQWAGYYPYCRGGGEPPECAIYQGTLFSAAGIRDQASRLDWYGEVFDSSAPAATSTDMGSGAFASTGWQHAAFFRNLTLYPTPTTFGWWNSGALSVTDSSCYSGSGPFYSSTSGWRNWFYFGGPGREASGCN